QGREPKVHSRMHVAADGEERGGHDRDRPGGVPAAGSRERVPADGAGAGCDRGRGAGEDDGGLRRI
ncbi:MAG: Succinyl-CoA:3-ketoacid-coenzyme A transferase subunit B, partial [uncultured Sphingomonadaceae bacterium]